MRAKKRSESQKYRPGGTGLLKLATAVGKLVSSASLESDTDRIAGKFLLDQTDMHAAAAAIVQLAIQGRLPFGGSPGDFVLLQLAIAQVSHDLWEDLWNKNHHDRYGAAWAETSQDFDLMKLWREKVRAIIKDCRQGAVLDMTCDDYVRKLREGGLEQEDTEGLTSWMSEVTEVAA